MWAEFLEGWNWLRARRGLFGLLWIFAGINLVLTLSNVLWVPVFLTFTDEASGITQLSTAVGILVWRLLEKQGYATPPTDDEE